MILFVDQFLLLGKKLFQRILNRIAVIVIFIVFPLTGFAQVFDNFSDGDFTNNPQWLGDTSLFQITNSSAIPPQLKPALQLNGSNSDTTILYLPNALVNNIEWQFWVKMSFNTSENNNARVYLVADQSDLYGNLNGYYVQLGGANDSISLMKQSGDEHIPIIKGLQAFTGNSTNVLRVKVTRGENGFWDLFADGEGGYSFAHEGSVADDEFSSGNYFGIFCKYTSSNASKFYFDDFYVNEIIVDTIPPKLVNIDVLSANQLDLYFDEPLNAAISEIELNYFISNEIGYPQNVLQDELDPAKVHFEIQNEFIPGLQYELSISNIEDLAGNIIQDTIAFFTYFITAEIFPYDIIINELMVDENPIPNNLPEADFLELYNRTSENLNLKNCTLQPRENSDPVTFPDVIIEPDSFLIVTANVDVELFEAFGQVVGLPSFSLNNEGAVTLRNVNGTLIHHLHYSKEWYHDEEKQEGGWSIEQIDPQHPCDGISNWKASDDDKGGSPGARNSVDGISYSLPEISAIALVDEDSIIIEFSHYMDSITILNSNAYLVDAGIGNPETISILDIGASAISLQFENSFETNMVYKLTIDDSLFNCSGDIIEMNEQYEILVPVEAFPNDVVINEIFADPTPPIGLPEYEFMEVFNTTDFFLNIKEWILIVGTTEKEIPNVVLPPKSYLIFTHENAVNYYGMYGQSIGFSSLSLTNGGTTLMLLNNEGEIISSVSYSDDWYHDSDKAEGGWSLEQIDPFSPCGGRLNWSASEAEAGGTPGKLNSIDALNILEPTAERVIYIDENHFELQFNQNMEQNELLVKLNYSVNQGIGNPVNVSLILNYLDRVELTFFEPLNKQTIYTLNINENIKNCTGIPISSYAEIEFGVAEEAEKNEVVINEILFNPLGNGVDFVEIYNTSEKLIDLSLLKLGTVKYNALEPNDTTYKDIADKGLILFPEEYQLLTTDPEIVNEQYFCPETKSLLKMSSFPSYNNESGTVLIKNSKGLIVDCIHYDEEMHHPLINTVEGVSLERVNFNRPSVDETNWHSAAASVGFATPGYKNSQFSELSEVADPIRIEPEIFSPDNDGYNDVVNINYNFGAAGYTASLSIYDSQGRLVKVLVNNEILGAQGAFSWDGRTDDNQKADIGMYIAYFEAFSMNGEVKKFKKTIVLGGKL